MLIAVIELSVHAKYHRKRKVLGRSWWNHIRPDGVWSNANISSLHSENISRKKKKKTINHSEIVENIYIQDGKYLHCVC